jgi:hypothetical protein
MTAAAAVVEPKTKLTRSRLLLLLLLLRVPAFFVAAFNRQPQAPKSQVDGLDSMRTFVEERNYWLEALGDKVHVMGSITDSHDIPRWLAEGNDDMSRYR